MKKNKIHPKLKVQRGKIDHIDQKICDLVILRSKVVAKIKDIKKKNRIPLKDSRREQEIVLNLTRHLSPDEARRIKKVYKAIFSRAR